MLHRTFSIFAVIFIFSLFLTSCGYFAIDAGTIKTDPEKSDYAYESTDTVDLQPDALPTQQSTESDVDYHDPEASPDPVVNSTEDIMIGFYEAISNSDRNALREWARNVSIKEINQAVTSLDGAERENLCNIVLDSNAEGENRTNLLGLMNIILSQPDLGFYSEIFSYTRINIGGDGFFYTSGMVSLTPDNFFALGDKDRRNTLMHECFHSFNDANSGPNGALNEGAAIWIYKKIFPEGGMAEDWAEATYGTKSYYKVYMNDPGYPLEAPAIFSPKLVEAFSWLSEGDPSMLPWWDDGLLKAMYAKYYEPINRDCDFNSEWLPAVENAKQAMINDPLMLSPDRIPMPTPAE